MSILKYWLNIDYPSKYVMFHRESCILCKPYQQKNKGVNELLSNGGWYDFTSMEDARAFYEKHYSSFKWNACKRCCTK